MTMMDEPFNPAALRRKGRGPETAGRRPESTVVADVLGYLRGLPHAYARKVHGGAYGNIGEPDIDAVVCGRAVKLECKRPGGGKPTAAQHAALLRWRGAGALVGWVTSREQVIELLAHLAEFDYAANLDYPGCRCGRY